MPEKKDPQPQKPKEHGFMHNAAHQFGQAVMFGAGATLGSDAVNGAIGEFKKKD